MIRETHDGRIVKTGSHYKQFRKALYKKQLGRCFGCGRPTELWEDIESNYSFHVHHLNGRGMGGSKRDDTERSCKGLCGFCHRRKHGQG